MAINNNLKAVLILLLLSFIFLMAGNNILSLTNPDEVFYAGTAKEMVQQKNWLVPYLFGKPQFEKPIFTCWLLRVAFMLFGVTDFSARFFPALFGMIGVIALYIFCLLCFGSREKAFLCAFILMTSGLFIGLSRTVFTDMIFSIFILLSLISFFMGYTRKNLKGAGIILFFIFSAFAVLTKGPLGLLIPLAVIVVFLMIRKEAGFLFCRYCCWGFLLFFLIAAPWYIFMFKKFGNSFIQEFFYNDHIRRLLQAEHRGNDRWYFYPLSTVLCIFPWSIFTAASFVYLLRRLKERGSLPVYSFVFSWIFTTLVMFQIAHSKLVSYIFPIFPALAVITGDFIHEAAIYNKRLLYLLSLTTLFILILFPVGLVVAASKYPMYVGSPFSLYIFIIVFMLSLILQFVILRRKHYFFPYLLASNIIIILFFTFLYHQKFDEYSSSKHSADYLENNAHVDNVILCSRLFVRGVRFYTAKEVAVINLGGTNFFSPHPIPFLNSDEKVEDFLNSQRLTYAVLNKSSLAGIERITKNKFKLNFLKKIGDEYIVVIKAKES